MLRGWKYPNLTLLVISLVVTVSLLTSGYLEEVVNNIGALGYLGIFLSGCLFVSTFTIGPGTALLFAFADSAHPVIVAGLGGIGAAVGDYVAYKFIRDKLLAELNPILKALHLYRRVNILHTKYFSWLAPAVGAVIIASPLPDEIGLTLLGMKKIHAVRFLLLAFSLNSVGIFLIALAGSR